MKYKRKIVPFKSSFVVKHNEIYILYNQWQFPTVSGPTTCERSHSTVTLLGIKIHVTHKTLFPGEDFWATAGKKKIAFGDGT